jgi:hypothetical protein
MNPEVTLAARAMTGVAFVAVRFVDHVKPLRGESSRKLLRDLGLHRHGAAIYGKRIVASTGAGFASRKSHLSRLEGGFTAFA